jgi:CRISPR-associated endonuclease Cas1
MDVRETIPTTQSATGELFHRDAENPAVCVVDGFGIEVTTRSGRLLVSDGIGRQRRQRVYNRATHGLSRVVIVATTGHVTIEAHRWIEATGIGLVMIDPNTGDVTSASIRVANDDARVRRAQALAPGTETGLEIAKYLIGLKLHGQAAIARDVFGASQIADSILSLERDISPLASLEEIRQYEASAANLYWSAWGPLDIPFVKKDAGRIPDNWKVWEGRRSAVTPGTPRNATDPVNAMINYSFRLLEAEGHLATVAVGLDPGMGVLHADMKGRASFVLDLIEAGRPIAERHVFQVIRNHPLQWRDFKEGTNGVVRVLPPLTHRLTEAMPLFGAALAPVVERVASLLAESSPYDVNMPSPLTGEKHKEAARRRVGCIPKVALAGSGMGLGAGASRIGPGIEGVAPRKKRRQKPQVSVGAGIPLPICKTCGAPLPLEPNRGRPRGTLCPQCLALRRREVGALLASGSKEHARKHAERTGENPAHTSVAEERRREANTRQRKAQAAWDREHAGEEFDPEWYRMQILPRLADVSLTTIARATGMSDSSASKVRAGRRMPHPRHWEALGELSHPWAAP